MAEYIIGAVLGGGCVGVYAIVRHYAARNAEVVEQEKDYALLQQHVDKCVGIIERIIYRSRP